ncbi:immediate early protein, putative [Babesia ovata]|uniref:Immediate early protein, putative n=1 Tax=Babesia ovata TaxID=189622 RepID=A0A2H6KD85_9APIC|nr:immediate early protein, putative [Babesia ovata]GBE60952.1 immediate early protein, putative [Babesia ovata]
MAVLGFVQFTTQRKKPINVANEVRRFCQFKEFCYLILKPQYRDAFADTDQNMFFRFSCVSVTDKCYNMECGPNSHCVHERGLAHCVCDQGSVKENGVCVDKFFAPSLFERNLALHEFETGLFQEAYDTTASFETDYQFRGPGTSGVPKPDAKINEDSKPSDDIKPDDGISNDKSSDDIKPDDDKSGDDGKQIDDKSGDNSNDVKPDDDKPSDNKPNDDIPSDNNPNDDIPSDDKPSDDKPSDDKSTDDVKPSDDVKLGVGEPDDVKPGDGTSNDVKTHDDKSGDDGKPGDVKPSDTKPDEGKPRDDDKPSDDGTSNDVKPSDGSTSNDDAKPDEGKPRDDDNSNGNGDSTPQPDQPSSTGDSDANSSPTGNSESESNSAGSGSPNSQDGLDGKPDDNSLPDPDASAANTPDDGSIGSGSDSNTDVEPSDNTNGSAGENTDATQGGPLNANEDKNAAVTNGSPESPPSTEDTIAGRNRSRRDVGINTDGTDSPITSTESDSRPLDPDASSHNTNGSGPPTGGSAHDAQGKHDKATQANLPPSSSDDVNKLPDLRINAGGATDGSAASVSHPKWAKIIRSNHLLAAITKLRTGIKHKKEGRTQGNTSTHGSSIIDVPPNPPNNQSSQSSNVPTVPVDDKGHLLHIDTTGKQVGGDEDTGGSRSELPHDEVTLVLSHVAVHAGDGEVPLLHLAGEHIYLSSCVAVDDGLGDGDGLVEIAERVKLVLFLVDHDVELLDTLQGKLVLLDEDTFRRPHELGRQLQDFVGHGGTEKRDLDIRRHSPEDLVNLSLESTRKHLVGFIEDEQLDLVRQKGLLVNHVVHTSGSTHDHVHTSLQLHNIVPHNGTTDTRVALDLEVVTKGEHDLHNYECLTSAHAPSGSAGPIPW